MFLYQKVSAVPAPPRQAQREWLLPGNRSTRSASPGYLTSNCNKHQRSQRIAQELTMSAPALLTGCTALVQAESFLNKTIDIVGVVADFQQPLPSRGEGA